MCGCTQPKHSARELGKRLKLDTTSMLARSPHGEKGHRRYDRISTQAAEDLRFAGSWAGRRPVGGCRALWRTIQPLLCAGLTRQKDARRAALFLPPFRLEPISLMRLHHTPEAHNHRPFRRFHTQACATNLGRHRRTLRISRTQAGLRFASRIQPSYWKGCLCHA